MVAEEIVLRRLHASDISAMLAIFQDAFCDDPTMELEIRRWRLLERHIHLFRHLQFLPPLQRLFCLYGVYKREKLIGFLQYAREDDDTVLLEHFAIRSEERSQGIGAAMLQKFFKKMQQQGFSCVILETKIHSNARHLYQRQGFQALRILGYWEYGRDSQKNRHDAKPIDFQRQRSFRLRAWIKSCIMHSETQVYKVFYRQRFLGMGRCIYEQKEKHCRIFLELLEEAETFRADVLARFTENIRKRYSDVKISFSFYQDSAEKDKAAKEAGFSCVVGYQQMEKILEPHCCMECFCDSCSGAFYSQSDAKLQ